MSTPATPAYTHAHPPTPLTYPLMPADALNLIKNMILHVNGKMAEERKKKEQESAEAISGLKMKFWHYSIKPQF